MTTPITAEDYCMRQLYEGVKLLLENIGFSAAQDSEIWRLAGIWRRTIYDYTRHTNLMKEATGRTIEIVEDTLAAFKFLKVPVPEVIDYAQKVVSKQLPALPPIPAPGPLEEDDDAYFKAMYSPAPSKEELKERPPHIPHYLPTMYPESSDTDKQTEDEKDVDVSVGIKNEKVKIDECMESKPQKREFKTSSIPVFDNMSFHELGFVSDEEEEIKPKYVSDISAVTGITSSANLTSAHHTGILPNTISSMSSVRQLPSSAKTSKYSTPHQSPPRETPEDHPMIRLSDIVKAKSNTQMAFDFPSTSNLRTNSFDGMPNLAKINKIPGRPGRPKKEKPIVCPRPKGRPPKIRTENEKKPKKGDESFLVGQYKEMEKFREDKEKREKEILGEQVKLQLLKTITERAIGKNVSSTAGPSNITSTENPLKIIIGGIQDSVPTNNSSFKSVSPKLAAVQTPSIQDISVVPPPVGAEVNIGAFDDNDATMSCFETSINTTMSETTMTSALTDKLLQNVDKSRDAPLSEISEVLPKDKKKRHKEKSQESTSPSHKKHKKRDKDSEEYKEYKRQKKEKKRMEKEKLEKERLEAAAMEKPKPEESTSKITLKIKFGESSIGSISNTTPMRPESAASDHSRSNSVFDKPMEYNQTPPPMKLKFKNLQGSAEVERVEEKVVPPLKLGSVFRLEESRKKEKEHKSHKKEKKDKERKKDKKDKEREKEKEIELEREREFEREREKEREKERKRELEREREREKEKERKRQEDEKKEMQRILEEKKRKEEEEERQRLREIEQGKEIERLRKEAQREQKRKKKERAEERKEKNKRSEPVSINPKPTQPLITKSDSEDSSDDEEIWICPVCSVAYTEGANMVCCDTCDDWFHWHCVGLIVEPAKDVSWHCQRCSIKKKHKELKRPSSRSETSSVKRKKSK